MNRLVCFVLVGVALLGAVGSARAADYYVTAKGAGARNGRSWDDGFPFSSINDILNRTMKPGDTLHVEGAPYGRVQIIIDSSGGAGAPKTIVGEDRGNGLPLFGPTDEEWMNWGQHGILVKAKSSHWIIKNLQFRLYAEPTVCTEGGHTGLVLDNLRVLCSYTGFKLVDCHDTVVRNCYATRYSAQGFLFLKHCDRVLVQNCEADGSQGEIPRTDVSQVGFQCGSNKDPEEDGNAHLTFENCVARNNLESDHKQGWVQGDGFVAERADRHLKFRRCRSFDASDGCFDLKAQIDEFADCVAVGPARCFKLWSQTMTMNNCIAILTVGGRFRTTGTTSALEVNNRSRNVPLNGHITAQSCTFSIRSRGPGVWGESGKVTMNDCIMSFASPQPENGAAKPNDRDVAAAYERTAIHWHASDSSPPNYLNPVADWDGMGTNYDSQTYGTSKGYHSSRVGRSR
jgi:hypothetical protein